ncbi:MAG: SusC/RagA family TonB-linked outer membrane protein [Bacteroidetes bacterium]|nr:SusC/RagA family TonB-linked outer membrane protein [Bacteroidota bacterium]MBU1484635.1 SusC/RagA family TonB-linked outer membrane protein [Bacteroidota bacterium]MBU1760605.1 SusC/RagA family TonB-linked outer membrane protein [Bacteroidota bacterium]MBU2045955.1 SusC/RagA family TonB-linked outer membrane protein [Bacteroidota bacterium]MBU2269087.1 SusC/RagA family TonB-linked outer membrane protein [Bacteroidota bacterium]
MQFKRLLSLSLLLIFFTFEFVSAQTKTIEGKVIDKKDGSPLIGVSVKVKNTNSGTVTDFNGKFQLKVNDGVTTLEVSYIGYKTIEVAIGTKRSYEIVLEADNTSLNEVVVVGYGTQKIKDATGSVATLGTKDFNKGVISSPEQLLQGRLAGVQVTPASGEPGSGININIRGTGSIRSGNNPLFVVDGVPLDGGGTSGGFDSGSGSSSARNPLSFLNPSDIENISVLKDASAAAIYGSRGANGVVIITTKKGSSGQGLSFLASTSVSSAAKRYDLLNATQFYAGVLNAGANPVAVDFKGNTNWQNEIFRTGVSQNYNLGYGGSNQTSNYRVSLGYDKIGGIVKNSSLGRLTGRLNGSKRILNDKVKLDLSLTGANVKNIYAPISDNAGFQGSLVGAAIQANPTYPVKNADGTFFFPGGDFRNPAAMLAYIDDSDKINRYLANISATWTITKGLNYKATLGLDNSNSLRQTFLDPRLQGYTGGSNFRGININQVTGNGRGVEQNLKLRSTLVEHTLTYDVNVAKNPLTALVGYSYQDFKSNAFYNVASDTKTPNVLVKDLNSFKTKVPTFGDSTRNELQSFFGRLNYNISDKYLLTATVRVDGSSKFGANNKYATFPAIAAKWKLMNENFIPKKVFTDLSIRLNYGKTGNQEYPGGASLAITQRQLDGSQVEINAANPNIKWETTTQYGAGLDFALFGGRLSSTVDYFDKSTTDLLFLQDYAQPAAFSRRWTNLPGEVINKGLEIGLDVKAIQGNKFNWEVAYNMTFLKNTVKNFGSSTVITGDINGQGLSGAYVQTIRDGYPLSSFNLPIFAGYDNNGFAIYPNDAAFKVVGSALPTFNAGLTNNFSYGKWNASFFINASTGFYLYNNTANALFTKGSLKNGRNVTVDVASSKENALNAPEVSTRFLEKGDFVRLSNASLGYTFNTANSKSFKNLRLSLSGQNLILITNYSGLDPEVNTNKARNNVPSRGIDYTAYPSARTFTLGLNASF